MAKLSKEAWTVAFFEVMKEQMPTSKSTLKRVAINLSDQKALAEQELKAKGSAAKRAQAIADDDEQKRYGAGVKYDQERTRILTEEGRKSAQREYDEAEQRARASADVAKQARLERKAAAFKLKELEAQTAEIAQRMEGGNLDGLSAELGLAMKHAQLEEGLKAQNAILADYEERLRLREEELQTARRNLRSGEALILEGDVASFKERTQHVKAKRDAIVALQPGFTLEEAQPSNTDKLAKTLQRMQGAAQASDDALAAEQDKLQQGQQAVKAKSGELEAAAARDPELKTTLDALTQERTALAQDQEALDNSQADLQSAEKNYAECQRLLDAYASGSADSPDERARNDALDVLSTRVKVLAREKADVREKQEALRKTAQEVEAAKSALAEAIDARVKKVGPDSELKLAYEALHTADADLGRAEQSQAQAKDDAARVHGLADEAARRLKHAQTLPVATETAANFNTALKGVENTPIWEDGGSTALLKKLGKERYERLQKLALKLTAEYETLCANGATMEELQAIYKDTPDLWKPPRFREEEKNWVAMKDLVDEEAEDKYRKESESRLSAVDKKLEAFKSKLEKGETVATALVKGQEAAEGLAKVADGTLKAIGEQLSAHKELAEKAEAVLGLAAKLADVVKAPLKAIDSAQKSMETEDPIEMLMLQDEFMSSLGELVSGLTGAIKGMNSLEIGGAVVTQIAGLLPGIGVATNAAEVMKGLVDSAARIQEAMDDADAHEQALQSAHRGEAAIDQFARRDKHLAARAATKTGVAMIKTAAAAVDLTGVGVTASTAMKGVATGISAVQTGFEQVIDRNEGEKAQALLKKAQAGDGQARAELFRYHPRYAKGILAIMASEGDAMALQVLNTHGLSEDMIRRSSPKIIKRYLLKKFGESDAPPSWTSARESIGSALESVSAKFQALDDFFGNVADKLLAKFDSNNLVAAQAALSDLAYQLSDQTSVSTAVSSLVEVRMRRESLAASATPEQAKDLQALDLALADELKKVEKVRTHVLASMEQVRLVIKKISEQPKSPLRDKAEAAAKAVLREHLTRVTALASAG